jgi:hypothetical protein
MVDGGPVERWESRIGLLNTYQGYGWVAGLLIGTVWAAATRPVFDPVFAEKLLFWLLSAAAGVGLLVVRLWYPERPTVSERGAAGCTEAYASARSPATSCGRRRSGWGARTGR